MHFIVPIMYTRYFGQSTLHTTIVLRVSSPEVFSYMVMEYASTPVFLSTGGLTSHTCIYGHVGVLSGMAKKQVFWKGQKTGFSNFRRLSS